jgi:hypothetical protein
LTIEGWVSPYLDAFLELCPLLYAKTTSGMDSGIFAGEIVASQAKGCEKTHSEMKSPADTSTVDRFVS